MGVAPYVYMAGWSCACSLHMHLGDSLAWLPIASAMYSMLLSDQQCMVNNAKGGKIVPCLPTSCTAKSQSMKWAGKCWLPKGNTATASTAMRAAVAGGCMWMMVHIMTPFQPKRLHLSQWHSVQNALCTTRTCMLQAA